MKFTLNRKWLLVAIAGLVAVAATIIGFKFWGDSAKAGDFLTAKVERGDIRNTVSATGALQAVRTVQVGSQVSGTISALYVDFNSTVRKGQVVAQLDPSILQAQVASQRANLEQARAGLADAQAKVQAAQSTVQNQRAGVSGAGANLAALKAQRDDALSLLKRQEALAASGLIPQRDLESSRTAYQAAEARYNQAAAQLDQARLSEQSSAGAGIAQARAQVQQAQAQVQQAQASLRLAEVNLSHTTITSPIDGVVVSRDVDVGQTVAASLSAPTLFTIAHDLTQMQVMANIDQADIGAINQSNRVNFTVDSFPGRTFEGTIRQIRLNPQNVQNVVTYNVVVDVQNRDLKLMPGMTANLTFAVAERTGVLKVPNAALRFVPQGMTQEKIREMMRAARAAEGGQGQQSAEGGQGQEQRGEKQAGQGQSQGQGQGQGQEQRGARQQGGSEGRPAGGEGQQRGRNFGAPTGPVVEGQTRIVWVLDANKQPQPRRIKVGITDGSATEIAQGNVQEGELVIIGQTVSGDRPQTSGQRPPGFGGPGGPGGFGGGAPGGGRRQ